MLASAAQVAFSISFLVHLGTALLVLSFGLLTRRQLGISTPLWIAAITALRLFVSLFYPGWNTQLVDRFMTDTPPLAISVGEAITLISLSSDVLYTGALVVLFATAMAELVEETRGRVDWGNGKFVSALLVLCCRRTQLCFVALALGAIGSVGPGIATLLLSV